VRDECPILREHPYDKFGKWEQFHSHLLFEISPDVRSSQHNGSKVFDVLNSPIELTPTPIFCLTLARMCEVASTGLNLVDEATRMKQLGQRIKEARERLALSQEDLAHKWGKQQYQVSEYERGKRRIYAHDLPQLADVLQVQISYFFDDKNNDEDHQANETDEDNKLEETLVYIFRDLNSASAQEFAVKVLRELRQMIHNQIDD